MALVPAKDEPRRLVVGAAIAAGAAGLGGGAAATLAVAWGESRAGHTLTTLAFDAGLVVAILAGVVAGGIASFLVVRLATTLEQALEAARRMASGDLGARIAETRGLSGQLGRLLNAVAGSGSRLLFSVRREQGRLNEQTAVLQSASARTRERATASLARIDRSGDAVAELDQSVRSIAENVETLSAGAEETAAAVAQVDASLTQLLARSEGLHRVSEESARAASSLADGAAVLDGTVAVLVRKSEDLKGVSRRSEDAMTAVASAAEEASQQAARAATEAALGGAVLQDVRDAVSALQVSAAAVRSAVARLEGRSSEIGRILLVMEEISRQTSLLALNASLLAARAGEHGRGFAVVASEIRKLSERSSEGARGIASLIDAMRSEVEAARAAADEEGRLVALGMKTAGKAEEAVSEIGAAAVRAEAAVSAIRAGVRGQAEVVGVTAAAIDEVSSGVASLAEEGKRNAHEADRMRDVVIRVRDLAAFVERTVQEQKGAASQIAVAADRSLSLMHGIQEALGRQTAESHRLVALLDDVAAGSRETLDSASAVEDVSATLETLAGSLGDEVSRFRLTGTDPRTTYT